jgi:CheY-like chemotaxis protein/PAS domain-containing protein/HPt (histidine-containing phosphotransfer) domain-containing protein
MSDNWNLSGEQVTGHVLRLDRQVVLLKTAIEEVRRATHLASGLERATRALFTDGGAIDFPSVPKVLSKLSRNRQMGALLTDAGGEILLANKSFYDFTGFQPGAAGGGELELYREQRGLSGVRTGMARNTELPWCEVLTSGQFKTQRLALSDGMRGERLRWLQFCCQPLLSANGSLEGVLTIVAEASEEIEIEDRLTSVIGLLTQQVDSIVQPTRRLNALMERVRRLDDFLPSSQGLSIETAALEDSLSDDQKHYRELLELDTSPPVSLSTQEQAPEQATISTEAASAIQAFEESFNIDLGETNVTGVAGVAGAKTHEAPVVSEIEAEHLATAPIEILPEAEELVESQMADELDIVATYIPSEDSDAELWSEFSDFAIEKMPNAVNQTEEEAEQLIEVPAPTPALENVVLEQKPQSEQQHEFAPEVVASESITSLVVAEEVGDIEPEPELELDIAKEPELELDLESEPEAEQEPELSVQPEELSVTMIEVPLPHPTVTRAAQGKCALVVDDIPVNQKLLVLQLKRLGFATDVSNNGQEALSRLSKLDYDVVFMDCDMPVVNGYDATIAIRKLEVETGRHIPIVAMTSHDREADKERCLASGMDDYLTKGVNASSLSRVIERVCDKSKQQDSSDSLDRLQSETEPFDAATMRANYTQEELNEVVRLFLTAMETFVNSMQKAIDSRDGALVASLASSIKGPSATLGLPLITIVSNDILSFSEAEDWPQVRLKYLKLKTVYMRSQDQLRKLCPDVFAEGVL